MSVISIRQSKQPLALRSMRLRCASPPQSYLQLDEISLIAGLTVLICIVSILFLAQTGRVASSGLQLQQLEHEHTQLMREAEAYRYRIAKASRLDVIAEQAQALGLRPAASEQLRYATINKPEVPVVASTLDR